MQSVEKQLEVGLKLAEVEYDALSEKEQGALKQAVWRFLTSAKKGRPEGVWAGSRLNPPTDDDLVALSAALSKQLGAAASGTPTEHPFVFSAGPIWSSDGSALLTVVEGGIVDRFLLAFWLRLASVGVERLRRCPHCNHAFFKVGRRRWCDRAECEKERGDAYWAEYKKTPNALRSRKKFYAKHGWTLGARKRNKKKGSAK